MKRIVSALPGRLAVVALALMAAALMGGVADTDTAVAIVCVDDYDCPAGQFCVDPGHCVPYSSPCVDDLDCLAGDCCINMSFCAPCPEACCYPDNSCGDYVPAACTSDGGSPQGSGTNCATVDCAAGPPPGVGGMVELHVGGPDAPAAASGSSAASNYAVPIAAAATAGALILTASAWYARRRWVR